MCCSVSNSYVADDLGVLTPSPKHPNFYILRRLSYLQVGECRDCICDIQVECSLSLSMDNKSSLKGA